MTRSMVRVLPLAMLLGGFVAACGSRVDVEKVPIGTPVEVTRQDGGVVTGKLHARDDQSLHVEVGRATRTIPRDQIASVELVKPDAPPPPLPPVAKFREYTVPEGTVLSAKLNTTVGSDSSRVGDPVEATLTQAIDVDGVEVFPVGSVVTGAVTRAESSGKVKGRASLAVDFHSIAVGDSSYTVSSSLEHTAAATKGSDVKKIGIPAAGGAILGAILGGKKGALIGATIGGGAGAVVVLTTSGPEVRYLQGTVVSLPLGQSIDVRVPIRK